MNFLVLKLAGYSTLTKNEETMKPGFYKTKNFIKKSDKKQMILKKRSIGKATERNLQLKLTTITHNLHAHMTFSFIKILEDIVILKKFEAKF